MKPYKKLICFLVCSALLSAVLFPALSETYSIPDIPAAEPMLNTDPEDESIIVPGAFTLTDGTGTPVEGKNGEYTITGGGEYTAKGALNGRVIVDAGEGEVTLGLKGAVLRCSTGAPVTIVSAGKIDIEAKKNTFNMISDERTEAVTGEEYDAAVWADVDLKISGRGTLIVASAAYAGIKSRDDLKLRNLTLKVTAADNALKGNDSVRIESGSMILISTGSDGIRTKSSGISKKGSQRGDVIIEGGHIDLYAARDGISAAHDVRITGDDTVLNVFTADRSKYSVNTAGGSGSEKAAYSAKGIKADNSIEIDGGCVTILSADDGIHDSSGKTLENGLKGTGSVTIAGGTVAVSAADDGIRADGVLTIAGGIVDIPGSHEGLEANRILIEGGNTRIYALDDGINACAGAETPLIMISGGTVDVTTSAGDTDAIDTNGDIMITGGFTLIKGGESGGMTAGSADAEGTLTVTGGAVAAFGGICATPGPGSVNTYISNGTVFPAGNYILRDTSGNELVRFTLDTEYVSLWISCGGITIGGRYTLWADTEEVLTWTQTEQSSGDSVGAGFRFGPGRR